MLLRDLRRTENVEEKVVCFIDDNKNKWGREVDGVIVAGGRNSIVENVREYNVDKVYTRDLFRRD